MGLNRLGRAVDSSDLKSALACTLDEAAGRHTDIFVAAIEVRRPNRQITKSFASRRLVGSWRALLHESEFITPSNGGFLDRHPSDALRVLEEIRRLVPNRLHVRRRKSDVEQERGPNRASGTCALRANLCAGVRFHQPNGPLAYRKGQGEIKLPEPWLLGSQTVSTAAARWNVGR